MTAIRVGGYAPADSVHSRALHCFADAVRREAGDQVTVEVVDNVMDLGRSTTDLFDMVTSGELTWCYFSTSYLGPSVPELQAIEIPFLFGSLAEAHAALDGAFGDALSAATRRTLGYEVLGYWDNGFRHLTNARRPVTHPDDARGMSIRVQPNPIHEALFSAWGMEPVPTELRAGIALIVAGEVDAQENPLANAVTYGVDHRYITLTGHLFGARGLYANADMMAALPAAVASAIRRAARQAIRFQRRSAAAHEDALRLTLAAEGRQVTALTAAQRASFRDAAADVVAAARDQVDDELLALLPPPHPAATPTDGGDEETWPT